jgi:hypothetical protein
MNDERFIEMLNLYIDRELSAEEVHEIEEAIAQSPDRQKIYRQYCRMERATQHVLAKSTAPQPSIPDLVAAARGHSNEVEFSTSSAPNKGRWLGWGTSMVSIAAACLAVVFVMQKPAPSSPNAAAPAFAQNTPQYEAKVSAADDSVYRTVFVLDTERSSDRLNAMRPATDSFAWMNQLQFMPIERAEIDSWQMEASEPIEVRSLNPRWISPVGLDDSPRREAMTAFQFQR